LALATTPAVGTLEEALIRRIGERSYKSWFERHVRFRFDEGGLIVGVPNLHLQEWLGKQFRPHIEAAAKQAAGKAIPVRFVIEPALFQAARSDQEAAAAESLEPAKSRKKVARPTPLPAETPPEPRYTTKATGDLFEAPRARPASPRAKSSRRWHHLADFVVGPCNRVAYASAQSVVESPGQGDNPVVIHGPVGTGKSHLLEGVYAGLRKACPDWRVTFITAEDFTNRFVQAMRLGKLAAFRKHFREVDALLLDDLHFLGGKKATQEEFLHTFNSLLADGRHIMVTCDCHPRLTEEFLPELADRLLGGAVWGLQPPDAATRLDLLRSKAAKLNALIDEKVLKFLADQLRGNVRELEGALNSLRHFAKVTGRLVDIPLAREALGDLLRHAVRVVTLADIDGAVCQVLRLPPGTLQSKARGWSVSHPRMLAVYLARKHTAASYGEIGQFFGGRNHSTAVAAEKRVRQWLVGDESLSLNERPWRVRELIEQAQRILGR
jgi:chromosomal replication initiator protein